MFIFKALKHYTSKIHKFTDLESLTTLGFRGEALSSLCALSDLAIVTRHSSAPHAIKIEYDHNGSIKTETPAARDVGTTVSLSNLFSSLPVRRKEFTKNLKREYGKMCQLLYAYCLVSKGVKYVLDAMLFILSHKRNICSVLQKLQLQDKLSSAM